MGCDIHLHAEIKLKNEWHHYATPSVPRSYRLFGKMAGVRNNEIDPISPPRGLPADISDVTRYDYDSWKEDAHSASWLGSSEIADLSDWLRSIDDDESDCFGYLFGNTYGSFSRYPDERPDGLEDIRFVFWFDN